MIDSYYVTWHYVINTYVNLELRNIDQYHYQTSGNWIWIRIMLIRQITSQKRQSSFGNLLVKQKSHVIFIHHLTMQKVTLFICLEAIQLSIWVDVATISPSESICWAHYVSITSSKFNFILNFKNYPLQHYNIYRNELHTKHMMATILFKDNLTNQISLVQGKSQ